MPFPNSTAIARIRHGENTDDLEIWFRGGHGCYVYFGLPQRLREALLAASAAVCTSASLSKALTSIYTSDDQKECGI